MVAAGITIQTKIRRMLNAGKSRITSKRRRCAGNIEIRFAPEDVVFLPRENTIR